MRTAAATFLALIALDPVCAISAESQLVQAINAVRSQGCGNLPAANNPLRQDSRLDRVAESQSTRRELKDALKDAGYRAVQVSVLEASGSDAAIVDNLARGGCRDVTNPVYRDVGVAKRDGHAWIVLAAPLIPPAASDAASVSRRVLELVNAVRSKSRRCGWKRFKPAPALSLSAVLQQAASAQASDMAARSALSHTGADGSTPADRATRAGYRWHFIGENIASGQATPEQVVDEWVGSPHHCANLMSSDFTEMGIAWAADPKSAGGIYWAQVFGSPSP